MKGIGGNIRATIQIKTVTENAIGEQVKQWRDVQSLRGWLDLSSGRAHYTYNAKIQESTHLFIGDYVPLDKRINASNSRMVINGKRYDIMYMDNPMQLKECSQWEIYLKYDGGNP